MSEEEEKDEYYFYKTDLLELIFSNLRNEIHVSKIIRNRFITLKFIFSSGIIMLLIANFTNLLSIPYLFTIVTIGILYIDLILNQRSVAIKRVGEYFRDNLEHAMFKDEKDEFFINPWEAFLFKYNNKKIGCISRMLIGNILLTVICIVMSFWIDIIPNLPQKHTFVLGIFIICFFIFDLIVNIKSIYLYS